MTGRSVVEPWGHAPGGGAVHRVTLAAGGTTARVMTWGASLQDLRIEGVDHPVILGADSFALYPARLRYWGAVVGPVANRIAGGRAPVAGRMTDFERNEANVTTLHGGTIGLHARNWRLAGADDRTCRFEVTHPHGAGGFPGPLHVAVLYEVTADGALDIRMEATSERPTLCNLAHHAYWTMGRSGIADQELWIDADHTLPVDNLKIPTGDPQSVAGSRFDFRKPRPVIRPGDAPLDHNFCLSGGPEMRPVCRLTSQTAQLTVETDQPGLQVYDGGGIAPGRGLEGQWLGPHAGLAIEPQGWPDAPNRPGYPSVALAPGDTYRQHSRFHVRPV